jgi:hypothetical protein
VVLSNYERNMVDVGYAPQPSPPSWIFLTALRSKNTVPESRFLSGRRQEIECVRLSGLRRYRVEQKQREGDCNLSRSNQLLFTLL